MYFIFIFSFFLFVFSVLVPGAPVRFNVWLYCTCSDLFAGVQVIIILQLRSQDVYVYKWEVYDLAHDYKHEWCGSSLLIQYNNACIFGAMALLPEYSPSVSALREKSYYYNVFPYISQSFCWLSRENYRVLRSPITQYR